MSYHAGTYPVWNKLNFTGSEKVILLNGADLKITHIGIAIHFFNLGVWYSRSLYYSIRTVSHLYLCEIYCGYITKSQDSLKLKIYKMFPICIKIIYLLKTNNEIKSIRIDLSTKNTFFKVKRKQDSVRFRMSSRASKIEANDNINVFVPIPLLKNLNLNFPQYFESKTAVAEPFRLAGKSVLIGMDVGLAIDVRLHLDHDL
ncbi:hypothetical protein NQ317_007776 [Molorchus minor]|uniref:Uncharacterized protein n=1 Tax=Molorchus minor TaxID=1323400 RepID=A0ABQ9JVS7_9CUCU|nr:hypothetical protein NQ317_007776 [Molorchus minor]